MQMLFKGASMIESGVNEKTKGVMQDLPKKDERQDQSQFDSSKIVLPPRKKHDYDPEHPNDYHCQR